MSLGPIGIVAVAHLARGEEEYSQWVLGRATKVVPFKKGTQMHSV